VDAAAQLAGTLRREGQTLEALGFRLWTMRAIVSGSSTGSLDASAAEVGDTLRNLRKAELNRAIQVSALSDDLHVSPDIPLIDLAAMIDEPWSSRLVAHHNSLLSGITGIDVMASEISHLLLINDSKTPDGLANQLVEQAVPRSLVWFLRLSATKPVTTSV
jgi:hypothetical protein